MNYRIKEHNSKSYEIQKRSIFGFWYNPDNIDAYTTGFFDTLNEAIDCIMTKINKPKPKIVWILKQQT